MTNTEDLPIIKGRPITKDDKDSIVEIKLKESIAKNISEQAIRIDAFTKQLITIQLAIPGLYAIAYKLVKGTEETKVAITGPELLLMFITFLIFAIALGLSLLSLFPMKYNVNINSNIQGKIRKLPLDSLRINEFYHYSAVTKRKLLMWATGLTYVGICFTVLTSMIV